MAIEIQHDPHGFGHFDIFNAISEFFNALGFSPRQIFIGMSDKEIRYWRNGRLFPSTAETEEHMILLNAIRVGLLNLMTAEQAFQWLRQPFKSQHDTREIGLPMQIFGERVPSRVEVLFNAAGYYQSALLVFEEVQSLGFDYNKWVMKQAMNGRSLAEIN